MAHPFKKLLPDDKGDLTMAIYIKEDQVVLNFGKKIRWFSLGAPELEAFIKVLQTRLEQLRNGKP